MNYDFDKIIDRKNTNSMNVEGWRKYIFRDNPNIKFSYADDEFIRMWVADMDFAVAPEIQKAMKDRIDKEILGYTSVFDKSFFSAFENWCISKYGWHINCDEIVFSEGVVPALYQLVEDLVLPCEKVLTFTPAYGPFKYSAHYSKRELLTSSLRACDGRYEIDWEDFEKKAAMAKVFILCHPHNPSGRVWTESELTKMSKIIEDNQLWVISDEIHCDILREGTKHTPMGKIMPKYGKLVTCMSASKTFNLAGLMQSIIMIRDKEERRRFKKRDKVGGLMNPVSIAAHQAAYEKGDAWLNQLQIYIDNNFKLTKKYTDKYWQELKFQIPGATYFAWLNMGIILPHIKDLPLFFAKNAGIILEGEDKLFVDNADGWIRLNLAMPKSVVKEGLDRIMQAVLKERAYVRK